MLKNLEISSTGTIGILCVHQARTDRETGKQRPYRGEYKQADLLNIASDFSSEFE